MDRSAVPDVVVQRLPLYLQSLGHMLQRGEEVVSSTELGRATGVSAAQVRKDLSYFGEFGKQGLGYDIGYLCEQLVRILQLDQEWHVILVGAGALGTALANYHRFGASRFVIRGVFDADPSKIGNSVGDLTILPMDQLETISEERHIEIAIIAVPGAHAQEVADALVEAGIKAILTYAPIRLIVPDRVHVEYMDPIAALQQMTYYL